MGEDQKPKIALDGVHVGDWVIRPVSATGTDGHLDTPASRERDRQGEEDARAAQHRVPDAVPAPVQAAEDVDASIEAAREASRGDGPEDLPIPILLHDPLTGKVIGST
jgi:hypothetical protein